MDRQSHGEGAVVAHAPWRRDAVPLPRYRLHFIQRSERADPQLAIADKVTQPLHHRDLEADVGFPVVVIARTQRISPVVNVCSYVAEDVGKALLVIACGVAGLNLALQVLEFVEDGGSGSIKFQYVANLGSTLTVPPKE